MKTQVEIANALFEEWSDKNYEGELERIAPENKEVRIEKGIYTYVFFDFNWNEEDEQLSYRFSVETDATRLARKVNQSKATDEDVYELKRIVDSAKVKEDFFLYTNDDTRFSIRKTNVLENGYEIAFGLSIDGERVEYAKANVTNDNEWKGFLIAMSRFFEEDPWETHNFIQEMKMIGENAFEIECKSFWNK